MARKPTGKKLRFDVFKRDGFVCQYCGRHPPTVVLVADHVSPVAEGGETVIDNLITACESCNQGKGARPLTSIPESLVSKAERMAEAEEQIRGYQDIFRARALRLEAEALEAWERLWGDLDGAGRYKTAADIISVRRFVEKLGVIQVLNMVDVAVGRKPRGGTARWKFFCGCCWKCIRDAEA